MAVCTATDGLATRHLRKRGKEEGREDDEEEKGEKKSSISICSSSTSSCFCLVFVLFFLWELVIKMTSVLLQLLERTELNKLPKGVQNKLERIVIALQNANESLKNQHERLKADSGGYHSNVLFLQIAI